LAPGPHQWLRSRVGCRGWLGSWLLLSATTDLPFEQWKEVLGSERLVGAILDRLTHRCHILEATGESYRLWDAKRRQKSGSSPKGRRREATESAEN
jgi:hypothetical protein